MTCLQTTDNGIQDKPPPTAKEEHFSSKPERRETKFTLPSSPVSLHGLCNQHAKLRCTRCRKTHYCSPKHQAEHWKLHKKQCEQVNLKDDTEISGTILREELKNIRKQFHFPSADSDFESLLKEIEDDELRKIEI